MIQNSQNNTCKIKNKDLSDYRIDSYRVQLFLAKFFYYVAAKEGLERTVLRAYELEPSSAEVNYLLCSYYYAVGEACRAQDVLKTLSAHNRTIAGEIFDTFERTQKVLQETYDMQNYWNNNDRPDSLVIVIFGRKLGQDGAMHPELLERLKYTLKLAIKYPSATIILTGGKGNYGVAESVVMKKWLVASGLRSARIITETSSADTLENIQNIASTLKRLRAKKVVFVSNTQHLKRAVVLIKEQYRNDKLLKTIDTNLGSSNFKADPVTLNTKDTLFVYRDVLRIAGFDMLDNNLKNQPLI